MTAFLEVMGGAVPAGVRLRIDDGAALDIGSANLSADRVLRERHFQCRMNSDGLLVQALGDASAWLNGKRLGRAICKTGDWIQAGTTMFRVMLYAGGSAAAAAAAIDAPRDRVVRALLAEVEHLHVMFDLADCGGIDGFLADWREHSIELAPAPTGGVVYLCSLRAMAHAIRPLVESGLGERYGIWIRQEEPGFGPHLLRYLSAKRWFPFHQPAVLQAFWEACPEKSRRAFLGPVRWMAVVEEEGGELRVLQASR